MWHLVIAFRKDRRYGHRNASLVVTVSSKDGINREFSLLWSRSFLGFGSLSSFSSEAVEFQPIAHYKQKRSDRKESKYAARANRNGGCKGGRSVAHIDC